MKRLEYLALQADCDRLEADCDRLQADCDRLEAELAKARAEIERLNVAAWRRMPHYDPMRRYDQCESD